MWMYLQQMNYENIVTRGQIGHNEDFSLLPQCLQLYSLIKRSFIEHFQVFAKIFSKKSAADLLYVEKSKHHKLYSISFY